MPTKLQTTSQTGNSFSEVGKVTMTLIGSDFELRCTSPLRIAKAIESGNLFNKYDLISLTEPGKNGSSRHLVPKVRFSGYINSQGIFLYSGLIAIHLINPSNPDKLRDWFGSNPKVFMAYTLDTGGVMVVFKERAWSESSYEKLLNEIIDDLSSTIDIKVDPKCIKRDYRAPIAYDPDIKVNTNGNRHF
jgi:hypothetical protein